MIHREDFEAINGYSNDYWDWGAEDDNLRKRCRAEGFALDHHDGTFRALQHVSRGFDKAGLSIATYTVVSQGHIPLKDPSSNLGQI